MKDRLLRIIVLCCCIALALAFAGVNVGDKLGWWRGEPVAGEEPALLRLLRFDNAPAPVTLVETSPGLRDYHYGLISNIEDFGPNIAAFRLVNAHRHPWADAFFRIILMLGSGWVVLPIVILLFLFRARCLPVVLISVAIETAVVMLMKEFLAQPRPVSLLDQVYTIGMLGWHSFPSGDTAMAFALAWPMQHRAKWYVRAPLIAYAVLVAYERVYFGHHFPLDVVAGAAIGIGAGLLAQWLVDRRRMQRERVPAEPARIPAGS